MSLIQAKKCIADLASLSVFFFALWLSTLHLLFIGHVFANSFKVTVHNLIALIIILSC